MVRLYCGHSRFNTIAAEDVWEYWSTNTLLILLWYIPNNLNFFFTHIFLQITTCSSMFLPIHYNHQFYSTCTRTRTKASLRPRSNQLLKFHPINRTVFCHTFSCGVSIRIFLLYLYVILVSEKHHLFRQVTFDI